MHQSHPQGMVPLTTVAEFYDLIGFSRPYGWIKPLTVNG